MLFVLVAHDIGSFSCSKEFSWIYSNPFKLLSGYKVERSTYPELRVRTDLVARQSSDARGEPVGRV